MNVGLSKSNFNQEIWSILREQKCLWFFVYGFMNFQLHGLGIWWNSTWGAGVSSDYWLSPLYIRSIPYCFYEKGLLPDRKPSCLLVLHQVTYKILLWKLSIIRYWFIAKDYERECVQNSDIYNKPWRKTLYSQSTYIYVSSSGNGGFTTMR